MTSEKYILAIDLGTSGPKVALFSLQGELIGSEFQENRILLLPDGGAEQSPAEWWDAIQAAVKRLLGKGLVPNEDIIVIGTTGQWSGTVAVDRDGNALGNAVIWMDSRGEPYIKKIGSGLVKVANFAIGKLIRWLQVTGGLPGSAGKDPIAHILYLKHVHPEIHRNTYKFLEPIDYLGLLLTGKFAASVNSIVLHWVTDNRNIMNIAYDEDLIRLSGMDRDKLPDLHPANAVLGPLLPKIAADWGLREDVQVIMGSPDVHSAAVGSGAVADFETHLYIGTSGWMTCHVPFKKTDIFHSLASLPSSIPGRYLLTNEQECAGVNLQYLRDNLFFHRDELTAAKPENAYRMFDQIAERTPAGSGHLIFAPWLYGERAPIEDRFVRGGFFNMSLHTNREHLVRAVFEGVAYNARWLLKYVEQFIGKPVEAINMVGGGAKSDVWCQIHADILNRPIRQMKDPIEVNVRGAAMLAAASLGYIRYEEIGARVPVAKTYTPDASHRKIYDELFNEFLAVYENNKKMYTRLNSRVAG
ncbi:MAG: xylulose kinase [Chloroflexi bacterium]|nr:xylulose kinase [Chloroflexota bacterium]MDL1944504.1 xylulose kinase [Chloroflexi bacterium CFX2]